MGWAVSVLSLHSGRGESERKVGRPKDVQPRSRLPRSQDDLIRPTQQVGQGDACLQPGQRGAQAEVRPEPERQVWVRVAGAVEPARVGEGRRVTVRRPDHCQHHRAGGDGRPVKVYLTSGNPVHPLEWGPVSEHLLDSNGQRGGARRVPVRAVAGAQSGTARRC